MTKRPSIRYPWLVILGISVSFFLTSYDTTAFNLALVSIQKDLGLNLSELDWVMTSMMIALGTFLVPGGKISDKYGHRTPMLLGLFLFTLVSFLGGFAQYAWQLIALRILQGVTGALFWPGMQSLSLHAVSEDKRSMAVGITQFCAAFGIAAGPLVSGQILTYLSWRWVFWTTVPISLLSLILLAIFIPKNAFSRNRKKIDYISAFFLCGCAFATIHSLDLIGKLGFGHSKSLAWCAISVALFWFFVMRDDSVDEPLIELEILRNKRFVSGVLIRMVAASSYFSFLFLTGYALQHIMMVSPEKAGFFFLPLTAGLMTFSLLTGFISKYYDLKKLMFIGLFGLALACLSYAITVRHSMDFWSIAPSLALMGISFGLLGATNTVFTIGSLPKKLSGTGAGVMTMLLMVCGSAGVVVASSFIRGIGVTSAIGYIAQKGIPLTEMQKNVVSASLTGTVSMKEALVHFGENTEVVLLSIRKGFFEAMSWDLYALCTLAFIAFAIFVPMHFRKVKKSL